MTGASMKNFLRKGERMEFASYGLWTSY